MVSLTAQQVLSKGFSGKKVGEIIKWSKEWDEDQIQGFLSTGKIPDIKKDTAIKPWTCLWWFINNPCVKDLLGSSNSQKRRWLEEGAVVINGQKLGPDDPFPGYDDDKIITQLIFFPNGSTITMIDGKLPQEKFVEYEHTDYWALGQL